jgi:hypothetical protein
MLGEWSWGICALMLLGIDVGILILSVYPLLEIGPSGCQSWVANVWGNSNVNSYLSSAPYIKSLALMPLKVVEKDIRVNDMIM